MTISPFSLSERVAVVTGGSRGIGAAIAAALAQAGAAVALIGRDTSALESTHQTIAQLGNRVMHVTADISDVKMIDFALEQVTSTFSQVDILINNAGIEHLCPSRDVTESVWDRIIDTNLKGAFFCAQAAAKRMRRGGSIVNVCSLTTEVGVRAAAAYGASKAGLAGLTRTLAAEWAQDGIRVNGIGPGYFRTQLTEEFYRDEQWQRAMLPKIPLQRFGRLDEVGGAVVFLCSDAASYITGQILYIDGGYLAAL